VKIALDFQHQSKLSWPIAVDGIEDEFLREYAPWPFRFYIFRGRQLELKSAPVDGTHRIDDIEEAIRNFETTISG